MSEKYQKELEEIKEQLNAKDAYQISWALFTVRQECIDELAKIDCKKCWMRHNSHREKDYDKLKSRLKKKVKQLNHAHRIFHDAHGWEV